MILTSIKKDNEMALNINNDIYIIYNKKVIK